MELGIGFDDLNDVAALVDPEKYKPETCEVLLRHGTKEDVLEESKLFCYMEQYYFCLFEWMPSQRRESGYSIIGSLPHIWDWR